MAHQRLTDATRALWNPTGVFLNTASYGLPPKPGWDALQAALDSWRSGRTSWEPWGDETDRARSAFARLVGVAARQVAVGATVSGLVALIAGSLDDGACVLAPDIEFTSNLFPWMVHAGRGVEVRTVPADRLADAVDGEVDVVAFSAVQSATGEVADLEAISAAAATHGAFTVVDATQACGWLPLDASRFDAVSCGAYKWLMSPRGTAFLTLSDRLAERVQPFQAGWFAGEDPHTSYYGPPLRLAADARRFDTSPAWFSWVGCAATLQVIERIGVEAIHAHDVGLANRFRAGLGLAPSDSAIVSVERDVDPNRLLAAGVVAAARAGRLRTSWHVYNTDADVDAALDAVGA